METRGPAQSLGAQAQTITAQVLSADLHHQILTAPTAITVRS